MKADHYTERYRAYCAEQGREPGEQMAHDRLRWPGGKMCGFILWIGERWREWRELRGVKSGVLSAADHADFDAWVTGRVANETAHAER